MNELAKLIAAQERDMRYGHKVFSIGLTDGMATKTVGQEGVFDTPDTLPLVQINRAARAMEKDRRELKRISARHSAMRRTQSHLGGRIVSCPSCGEERRIIYLVAEYDHACHRCAGLARRKPVDRCDKGHEGEIVYKPIKRRPGTMQRTCRVCERIKARNYMRAKRAAMRAAA